MKIITLHLLGIYNNHLGEDIMNIEKLGKKLSIDTKNAMLKLYHIVRNIR